MGGGDAGDFGVGGAVGLVAGFAEAGGVGGQELRGVAGDGVGEGGDAAFNGDVQVKGGVGVLGVGEFDDHGSAGGATEGVFVDVAEAEAAEDDAAVGGAELDVLDVDVGSRVAPGPEVEGVGGDAAGDLGEGPAHLVALGGVARDELVVHVGHGEEGGSGGADVGDEVRGGDEPADFEAFADGELGLLAVGVVDDVGGDVVAGDAAAVELGVDEDVGEDEGVGGLADVNVDGLGVAAVAEEGEPGGGRVADLEGNAAVGLLAEGVGGVGAEEVGGGVAEGGEVKGLVVGHRALPVGGWWTAGGWMVGGNGGGVNFGGEFGGLVRLKSFFQKTLEAARGGFWRGWGGRGEGRGRRSERWKGGARWERLGRLRGVGAGWLGGTEDVAAGGYRLGVVREETRPGAGFQRHDEPAAAWYGAFWGNTRPPARLPLWGSRAGGRGLWRVFRSEFARFWSQGQGGRELRPREVRTRSGAGWAGWGRGCGRFGTGAWNGECGLAGSPRVDGRVNRRAAGGTRRMSGRSGDRSCANQAKSIGKWVAGLTRIVYTIWGQVASGWWLVVGEGGVDRGLGMQG